MRVLTRLPRTADPQHSLGERTHLRYRQSHEMEWLAH